MKVALLSSDDRKVALLTRAVARWGAVGCAPVVGAVPRRGEPPGPVVMPVVVAVIVMLVVLAFVIGGVAVMVGIGWGVVALLRAMVRSVLPGRTEPPRVAVPVQAARVRPEETWRRARERFHGLRAEYAAFECDALRVLRLPALADVSVPSTARFVDAFAEAQGLETDDHPGHAHGSRFVAAVERAVRTWAAAREAAERIRLGGLDPAERGTVERIIKLLTTARDSDSEPERLAAYTRARTELAKLDRAGVVHVPLPAQAVLDAAARGQLPPSGS